VPFEKKWLRLDPSCFRTRGTWAGNAAKEKMNNVHHNPCRAHKVKYMFKKIVFVSFALFVASSSFAQEKKDTTIVPTFVLEPLSIRDVWSAENDAPFALTNLKPMDIDKINTGVDLPFLLRFTPSLTVTSDAGNGIGYTGLWIRGSDPTRVNVSINGVPLNDPESQQVFWVNTPDLASSSSNIQIQRGIGTSSNGTGSFGGSIHLDTDTDLERDFVRLNAGGGSFGSNKLMVEIGSRRNPNFEYNLRASSIQSNGYIDRAETRLFSYFTKGKWRLTQAENRKSELTFFVFGGKENTYQAWNGTPYEKLFGTTADILAFAGRNGASQADINNLLNSGRTYNAYLYENEIDNYRQDHAQAHYFSSRKKNGATHEFRTAFHFTHGEGYFEQFKTDQDVTNYNMLPQIVNGDTLSLTNLVRRRWLNNNFYGATSSYVIRKSKFTSTSGVGVNHYSGQHYGRVIATGTPLIFVVDHQYYYGQSDKYDANAFSKFEWAVVPRKLILNADIQARYVAYKTKGTDNDQRAYDVDMYTNFLNPKVGLRYYAGKFVSVYASVAHSGKEPNRNDFVDASFGQTPKNEYMTDIEAGLHFENDYLFKFDVNLYSMSYNNQLVLTGALNDVGAPLRTNVAQSYRRGIELSSSAYFKQRLKVGANLTLSENKIIDFQERIFNYDNYSEEVIARGTTNIAFSPNVVAGLRAEYQVFPHGWRMTMKPVRKQLYLLFNEKFVGKQHLDNTGSSTAVITAFAVSDFGIQWDSKYGPKPSVKITFWVNNAFNRMYASNGYAYSYIYGGTVTERFYYPQAGRNYMLNFAFEIN
jgi:iron complex outermembrane receptor protein